MNHKQKGERYQGEKYDMSMYLKITILNRIFIFVFVYSFVWIFTLIGLSISFHVAFS